MRTLRVGRFGLAIGLLGLSGPACEPGPAEARAPDIHQTLFLIHSLSTQQEVQAIKTSLRRESGVKTVVTDLPNAKVRVTYDANLASERGLEQAIASAGYTASVASEDGP